MFGGKSKRVHVMINGIRRTFFLLALLVALTLIAVRQHRRLARYEFRALPHTDTVLAEGEVGQAGDEQAMEVLAQSNTEVGAGGAAEGSLRSAAQRACRDELPHMDYVLA